LNKARKADARDQIRPEKQAQPREREFKYQDPASAAAEEGIIRLLYLEPSLAKGAVLPSEDDFSAPVLGKIYGTILRKIRNGDNISTGSLSGELSLGEMSLLVDILQKPELLSNADRTLNDYINKLQDNKNISAQSTDLRALASKLRERKGFEG